MIHAFTSSAPNYIGKVRALFESLGRHCPDTYFHWIVADKRDDALLRNLDSEPFHEICFATDIEPGRDLSWLFKHTLVELSTAIKPFAALEIIDRPDCELLLYLDPDIVVFSPLNDLVAELTQASVVLTPHILQPQKGMEAVLDHELCALRHGVFNLGFLGVNKTDEGRRFLEWWRDRCDAFCWSDMQDGVFTDQKWVNFTPIFFPSSKILRSPRFNVAPWNINDRDLHGTFDEGFCVGDEPLGFFHFSGFDGGAHRAMIEKYAGAKRAPRALADWYESHTAALAQGAPTEWLLGTYQNANPIEAHHRRIYRDRVDLQDAFPDPYATPDNDPSYYGWLESTAPVEYPQLFGGR